VTILSNIDAIGFAEPNSAKAQAKTQAKRQLGKAFSLFQGRKIEPSLIQGRLRPKKSAIDLLSVPSFIIYLVYESLSY
jgi:hypothetical protein